MLIAAPTFIESYAVLTRLPPPHRMAPEVVLQIIEESFVGHGQVVALDGRSYRTLVHRLADTSVTGGRAYDAVIAECALRERDVTLLTFNERDFTPFTDARAGDRRAWALNTPRLSARVHERHSDGEFVGGADC